MSAYRTVNIEMLLRGEVRILKLVDKYIKPHLNLVGLGVLIDHIVL